MIEERIQAAKQYVKTLFADRADGHDVNISSAFIPMLWESHESRRPMWYEIVGLSNTATMLMMIELFQTGE